MTWEFPASCGGEGATPQRKRVWNEGEKMANTASILWPTAQPSSAVEVGTGSDWPFYTRVSVSGPSVCTTVHRGESLRGARATLTRDDIEAEPNEHYRDPDVSTQSRQ